MNKRKPFLQKSSIMKNTVGTMLKYTSDRYNLRNNPHFSIQLLQSVYDSLETLSYLVSKIWETQPTDLKYEFKAL